MLWNLPTELDNRLSLFGRFSSGKVGDSSLAAFVPINTRYQGDVLRAKPSGISIISLDYSARLHRTLAAGLTGSYIILSDKGTYQGVIPGKDGYLLGAELYGRLLWSPISDLSLNLGGGIFLPSLGNADPNADLQWRVELSAVIALY